MMGNPEKKNLPGRRMLTISRISYKRLMSPCCEIRSIMRPTYFQPRVAAPDYSLTAANALDPAPVRRPRALLIRPVSERIITRHTPSVPIAEDLASRHAGAVGADQRPGA